jgi:hypothetical protein
MHALTDCKDLFELVTGSKGIPQDRTQRLLTLALREKRLLRKFSMFLWQRTKDMIANALTKYEAADYALNLLLETGRIHTKEEASLSNSPAKTLNYSEHDLLYCTT